MDTSVLVAGIAGFKSIETSMPNPSAQLLRQWVEDGRFTWLVSEEILDEYKAVLARLRVRRSVIGAVTNRLTEEAEFIEVGRSVEISPDPADDPFCNCAEQGQADFHRYTQAEGLPSATSSSESD